MNSKAITKLAGGPKAAFADIWGAVSEFDSGLDSAKIDVAVVLCSLLKAAGITRTELSERLNWKPSRVTRVLSGDENLTIKTVYEICHTVGFTFDMVVRRAGERQAVQPWQKAAIAMDIVQVRKTLNSRLTEAEAILATAKSISRRQFSKAAEWKQKTKKPAVMSFTQTFAANDANHYDAAVTG